MHSALKGTANADLVVHALRRAFGERIPYRPDMVEILPTVAATVAAEAPALVPALKVTNSTSGYDHNLADPLWTIDATLKNKDNGRESGRDRVCPSGYVSVDAEYL